MDPDILCEIFKDRLPINGHECKSILKSATGKKYDDTDAFAHPCIYVGHCEVTNLDGDTVKGPTKIGKSKYLPATDRGRSQGGCDWFFDYIHFIKEGDTHSRLEAEIHSKLKSFSLQKPGHKELYTLTIEEAIEKVRAIIENV